MQHIRKYVYNFIKVYCLHIYQVFCLEFFGLKNQTRGHVAHEPQ